MPDKEKYIFDIDDRLPLKYGVSQGFQWAFLVFPTLIIFAVLCGNALNLDPSQQVRFFQLSLLIYGTASCIQTLWGHRYPVVEGPATALFLTFLALVPHGLPSIQGGTILGAGLLCLFVLIGKLDRVISLATPNVIGVILLLISLTLLPHVARNMIGGTTTTPEGSALIFLISLLLTLTMAVFSFWLRGFWRSIGILLGMLLGTFIFLLLGRLEWIQLQGAAWIAFPRNWIPGTPSFYWPACIAFALAYLAVMVNSIGSLHGIAKVTDDKRLPNSIRRGLFINGLSGISCGLFGVVGTVSFSISPGVVLANRVASRFAITYFGVILIVAAFVPKLSALLSLVPGPVVGAAFCVALAGQIGAGIAIIAGKRIESRDYFVVGLPVMLGTIVGILPKAFYASIPKALQVLLNNGLIVGIVVVLLLEHVLLRKTSTPSS